MFVSVPKLLGTASACGAPGWFAAAGKLSPVLLALVAARIIEPAAKRATSSLGRVLKVGDADQNDLYAALDWLGAHQESIERRLARKHLAGGVLVRYDLTSTWLTGRCCSLAARGYSRDGKRAIRTVWSASFKIYNWLTMTTTLPTQSDCIR